MNGNNILIYQGSTAIAGTKSNDIQVDCQMIETANPSSGGWQQFMAGRKNWTVQTSWLLSAVSDLQKLLTVGTTYTLIFKDRSGTSGVKGTAILQSAKITATRGSLCQGQFVFQGSGALTSGTSA